MFLPFEGLYAAVVRRGLVETLQMCIRDSYTEGKGWHDARIVPYGDFALDPAAMVLHYGQAIFEGMKAYRNPDGNIQLFRPMDNLRRFNRSAERLCIPAIDCDFVLYSLRQLIGMEQDLSLIHS